MPVFGEIINTKIPVLITFCADWHYLSEQINVILREVSIVMGDDAKIIKMDVDKNRELTKAFQINGLPTFILYYLGDVVWREEGVDSADILIEKIQKYTKKE
ncbi:thioredoxin family protein [Capnocytophaga catalasegens]|uniref:Thioredoxin domain-containing protein n=1 Tax=Capnocytophaga catalasegens TaxID=1004260 RepID=A0AAV5AUB4_9FLAO|nr:thioredoxin family protein [Capnocytophaga catalasegens]GIZ16164.1 hypothetical protein RCZ03_21640 [Capnocytophaga catalasegens]GJM50892.1 hypothetical protein RCZ15_18650 [Capnocytophaga catalasegens]GJM53736.1 hypothetical protein RCZ16_20520 [Capnocytophaga catalasegens]